MAWLNINKAPLSKSTKRDAPSNLWFRCQKCGEVIFRKDFEANQQVCVKCNYHYPLGAQERLLQFLDTSTFSAFDKELESVDPLKFTDKKKYTSRIKAAQSKTQLKDAFISGYGKLHDKPVHVGSYDFRFMGGSMGSVVGEKITRLFQRSLKETLPVVIFSTSGGARMQEGLLSLMQMAKTCTALGNLRREGIPFISVMTNPTTGGVAASYAMLGDINIGEPQALIGFAGPRVIQQTIGQELPEGFQTSEYLLQHGMLDIICSRHQLRDKIAQLLDLLGT